MEDIYELLQASLAEAMGISTNSRLEGIWNNAIQLSNRNFPAFDEFVHALHIDDVRGQIEVAYEIICNLNHQYQLAEEPKRESFFC